MTTPQAAASGEPGTAASATPASPAAAAAPASSAAPAAGDPTPPAATGDPAAPAASDPAKPASDPNAPQFKLNEAYKDKPWAAKIKTEEDLYKQVDELTGLIGKKTIVQDAETLSKLDDAQREEVYAQTRPKDVAEYKFVEGTDPAFVEGVGEILMKYGLDAYRANGILADYAAAEKTEVAKTYAPEGMTGEMEKLFGKGYNPTPLNSILKGTLTPETYAHVNKMPNFVLATLHKAMSEFTKAYGINESNAHLAAGHGTGGGADIEKTRGELRTKIHALRTKPHEASEKQSLVDQLNATYNNDTRKGQ